MGLCSSSNKAREEVPPSIHSIGKDAEEVEAMEFQDLIPWNTLPLFNESNYKYYDILGKGAFGSVVSAEYKKTVYALKIMDLQLTRTDHGGVYVKRCDNERVLLNIIKHPFFTEFSGEFQKDKRYMMFLLEYCKGGNLRDFVEKRGKLPEKEVVFIAAQVLSFLSYLHKLRIVHRDIRPDNILMHEDNFVRVCDLGIATEIRDFDRLSEKYRPNSGKKFKKPPHIRALSKQILDPEVGQGPLLTRIGAAGWRPPEMLKLEGYDFGVDFWNLGMCIFFMLTGGKSPFKNGVMGHLIDRDEVTLNSEVELPKYLSEDAKDLLSRILVKDSRARISSVAEEIKRSSIIPDPTTILEEDTVVEETTGVDEDDRFLGDGLDIKRHAFFKDIDWDSLDAKTMKPPFDLGLKTSTKNQKPKFQTIEDILGEFEAMDINTHLDQIM